MKRLADWFVLCPSQNSISFSDKERCVVPYSGGDLELFEQHLDAGNDFDLCILKFVGAGGRAERASVHPAECVPKLAARMWTMNMPGFGGSTGPATLSRVAVAAVAAYQHVATVAGNRPILITGNSLGTAAALYVARHHRVEGLILRNPPPIRDVIIGRGAWWNLWIGPRLVARTVPVELDSVQNASHVNTPTVFVRSGADRVVPPHLQQRVIEALSAPSRVVELDGADHATPMNGPQSEEYLRCLQWLWQEMKLIAPPIDSEVRSS